MTTENIKIEIPCEEERQIFAEFLKDNPKIDALSNMITRIDIIQDNYLHNKTL